MAGLALFLALVCQNFPALAKSTDGQFVEHAVIGDALRPVKADLEAILKRRLLRVAIPFTPIYFSYNGDKLIGFAVDMSRELETYFKASLGKKVDVLLIPLPRDQIIPAVVEGRADLAMANLTITYARQQRVAFSDPIFTGISEIVVTGPASESIQSFDDLAEAGVFLRPSSSYYAHLQTINAAREAVGKSRIPVTEVGPYLEDYDLLDLIDNGVIPATVVDSHKLKLWQKVFKNIKVHDDLTLNEGGEIAWAARKGSAKLLEAVNGFIAKARKGTLLGNILTKRYFGSANWIEEIRRGDALRKRDKIMGLIREYSAEYHFDWRLIFAQAYQESRLDQNKVSAAGAVGVMQIRPATAGDQNVAVSDVGTLENNIHAGIKYLDFIRSRYFDDPRVSAQDRVFFSLAAYNAGPRKIAEARKRAERMGLDPDAWFSNVEIAAAKSIGSEPVVYVRKIYKNYVSFSLISTKASVDDGLPRPETGKPVAGDSRTLTLALGAVVLVTLGLGIGIVARRRSSRGSKV